MEHPDGTTPMKMVDHALEYARRGWYVVPLHTPNPNRPNGCSCRNRVCGNSAGKHPRISNWQNTASIDPEQIKAWWLKWPDANIGVVTGQKSGLVALDVDDRDAGSETLASLVLEIGDLPPTLTASSGNGGHLLFKHPGVAVRNSTGEIGVGLDIRGENGYIVVAPSRHRNGKQYAWANDLPLADFPPALHARMTTKKTGRIDHDAPERNNARKRSLFKKASSLRGQEAMELPELLPALHEYNAGFDSPKENYWVETIAKSVCKQYPAERGKPSYGSPVHYWHFKDPDWLARTATMSVYQRGLYIQLKTIAHQHGGYPRRTAWFEP
jgi:Bifunctional DNA primase/polymerase, N-terminal